VWLFVGALVGLANVYSIALTVVRIRPNARVRAVLTTVGGALLRYGVVAVVLSLALQRSALSGISAFVGLFVVRWIAVYLMNTGRLMWNWVRH
jgi:hypothetical protein